MTELPIVISIIGASIALLSFLHSKFMSEVAIRERLSKIEETASDLEDKIEDRHSSGKIYFDQQYTHIIERLVNLEANTREFPIYKAKMDVFWKAIEDHVPGLLLHPDAQKRDVLLMKSKDKTISPEEAAELSAILKVDIHHAEGEDAKVFALLWAIKMDYKAQRIE